jgi:hypothetical protein
VGANEQAGDDERRPPRARAPYSAEAAVRALAEAQFGRVSRDQALGEGLTRGAFNHLVDRHHLIRRLPGVLAVGHVSASPEAAWTEALLWGGPSAGLSFGTSGAVWTVCPPDAVVHVTIPGGSRRSPTGLKVHRTRDAPALGLVTVNGWRVTGLVRTILDLACVSSGPELVWIVRAAMEHRRLRMDTLAMALARHPGHPGTRRVLAVIAGETPPTRSEFEELFLRFLHQRGFPPPLVNHRIVVEGRRREIDFFWPQFGTGVETDGFRFHAGRTHFENDHDKAAALAAAGVRGLRVTWRQFRGEPDLLDRRLDALLRLGGWGGRR